MKEILHRPTDCSARDPYIFRHNGLFYHCFSRDGTSISISCADSIEGLSRAEEKIVFLAEEGKAYSKEIWAPELYIIDGRCYIYFAGDDGDNRNHRMYVLANDSTDPMMPYTMCGKITDSTDKWAIDGNLMEYRGERYYLWAGWDGDDNISQNIYIAKMKSPTELASERVLISKPEYEWETRGSGGVEKLPAINEGPFAFCHMGKYYVAYSASGSWCEEYCIAILELIGDNPMDPASWKKHEKPVLSANDIVKGSGHCSIICEGETLHVFFHAWNKNEQNITWNTVSLWRGIMRLTDDGFIIE